MRDEVDPANPPGLLDRLMSMIGLKKEITKRVLRGPRGEPMTVEFLVDDPNAGTIRICSTSSRSNDLGIEVTIRIVDAPQYQNRLRQWDFEIVVASWPESLSPGNEQLDFWGSKAADDPGSRNLIGIKNPAVDALINAVIFAKDRAELVAATKALDRVLLWNHYVVPQWTYGKAALRRAGIDSRGRRSCRNTAHRRFRRSGGGTRKRRPRWERGSDLAPPSAAVDRWRGDGGELAHRDGALTPLPPRRLRRTPNVTASRPSAI